LPETAPGGLPFRVPPTRRPESSDIAPHNTEILSDHDLAVIQKALTLARQDGKDDPQDAAAGQHEPGPGPGPPADEPRETRPPKSRYSAPPPAITQAAPAANPEPPWGTVLVNTIRLWTQRRFWPAATRWRAIGALIPVPGPSRAMGRAASVPTPAAVRRLKESRARRRRRLLLYALGAASIVVAAALVDHWGVLPRVGASTSSSPMQVGGSPHRPQLLPPLGQPPVMHFSTAVDATSAAAEPSAQPTSPAAQPSGRRTQHLNQPGRRHLSKATARDG
jgi:hypothetical protein